MNVDEVVAVTIGLSATPASQARFTVPLLLVDHADVPIDRRYIQVTRSSYATDLTAATDALSWCTTLWGQNYNPSQAYIGRWASAATPSQIVHSAATSTIATWQAVTDGYYKVTDGSGSDEVGPLNFSTDTTMAQVCSRIQTAIQAIGAPNITGIDTATFALDALDRPQLSHSVTGAAAASLSTTTASTGTDLAGSTLLGSGFSVAGLDAESLSAALNAILAKDNTPYLICQRGGSIAQVVAFSTAVNALKKYLFIREGDTDAKDSVATSDISYQVSQLSHNKTYLIYTEHTVANGAAADQNPDAAAIGEIATRLEGSTSFALTPLSGLSESGLDPDGTTVIPLTTGERTALEAKGCDYLVTPSTQTHCANGLAAGGNEVRVMIGKEWMAAKISEGVYGYLVAQDVVTFSDDDIQAIEGIVRYWYEEAVDRKLLAAGATITMPSADDFTAATKATHTMALSDIADMDVQQSVNDITITFTWNV